MLDNTRPYTSGRVNVRSVSRGGVRPGAEELLRASMETHGKNKENVAASQRRARLSLPGFDLTAQNREGTPGGVDQLMDLGVTKGLLSDSMRENGRLRDENGRLRSENSALREQGGGGD